MGNIDKIDSRNNNDIIDNTKEKADTGDTEIHDQELTVDNPDNASAAKISTPKKRSRTKESPHATKEKKDLREKLLNNLSEDELNDLLLSKQMLEEKIQLLDEKSKLLSDYEDLLKRKQAEFENFRKRVQREFEDHKKYATVDIVLDILNIIDDFERAIESAKSSKNFNTLLEGILLVERQLKSLLENKHGVQTIETVGREFDPMVHDAIMMEESEEYSEDMVIEDFQKGYKMHDRIIRPAKVKVAKAVSSEDDTSNDADISDERQSSEKGV